MDGAVVAVVAAVPWLLLFVEGLVGDKVGVGLDGLLLLFSFSLLFGRMPGS
jgi:hypothetical protein